MVSNAGRAAPPGVGTATSRARCGWPKPGAVNIVQPSRTIGCGQRGDRHDARPTLAAAFTHAAMAVSVAAGGAVCGPVAEDDT